MNINDVRPRPLAPVNTLVDVPEGVPFEGTLVGDPTNKPHLLVKVRYSTNYPIKGDQVAGVGYILDLKSGVVFWHQPGGITCIVDKVLKIFRDHELILRP